MRRNIFLLTLSIFLMISIEPGFGQGFKVLQVGDTIPEFLYREVADLGTAGKLFSNTKDKLIILDFWNTYCSTCIASFPKMQALQDEFKDEIQIFLVNGSEDSLHVMERMKRYTLEHKTIDLPIISDAKVFRELFPYKFVPHHVWIDGDGIVQMIGSPLNTNSEKIRSLLNKEELFYLKGPNNSRPVDEKTSLYDIEGKMRNTSADYSYLFTKHNNEYSANNEIAFAGVKELTFRQKRDTYINYDVLDLYKSVFIKEITSKRNKMIYNGVPFSNSGFWMKFFVLDVQDTLKLTNSFIPWIKCTDQDYIQSRYCYEQLSPMDSSEKERRLYMLMNLNNFFGEKLGIKGSLIEKEVLCYVLKSDKDDLIPNNTEGITSINAALRQIISDMFSKSPNQYLPFMIDETGLEEVEGLVLPEFGEDCTFEDIELSLNKVGIIITQEFRPFNFVWIEDM